jgi:hypothetical protein
MCWDVDQNPAGIAYTAKDVEALPDIKKKLMLTWGKMTPRPGNCEIICK